MRLLHVMPRYWPARGGAESYWQEISERMAGAGHAVSVYTTNAQDIELFWDPRCAAVPDAVETHNGVSINRYPVRHLLPWPIGYRAMRRVLAGASEWGAPRPLLSALASGAPYVPALSRALHSHREPLDLVAGVNIVYEALLFAALDRARAGHIPFVLCPFTHLGEPGDRSVSRFYTMRHQVWLAAQSSAVLVSTRGEAEFYASRGIPPDRLVRMGTGITPERVLGGDAASARRKYGIRGALVLFLGTVSTDKGARQAVQAIHELEARGVSADLVLAGAPLDEFEQFFRAQPAGIQSRCRLLGFVSDEDKRNLLAACDALVLPSRTDLFPTVFLEAWLYDKPVIGARAGGIPDVIDDERDGLLVPFGDARALADALARLLTQRAVGGEFGRRGREKVYSRYTWDRLYARIAEVYARLVARAGLAELSWQKE